jgi:ribose 1,5-bisphosphokinase PhnN
MRKRYVIFVLGSRAYVMRTRRLYARLYVVVFTREWHGYGDIEAAET